MDLINEDFVTAQKLNDLFTWYRSNVEAAETSRSVLLSRYNNLVNKRLQLNTRKTNIEALYNALLAASAGSVPSNATQITQNTTNDTSLTAIESSINTSVSSINAIVPGTTHLAYSSNWATTKFAAFSPINGACIGVDASGNWVSAVAPISNGYPEIATLRTTSAGNGGTLTANTWQKRAFNTISMQSGSNWISLVNGDVRLIPGFYLLKYSAVTNGCDASQTIIVNAVNGNLIRRGNSVNGIQGTTEAASINQNHYILSILQLTVETTLQFQVWANTVNTFDPTFSLGRATSGDNTYQLLDIIRMEGR